MCDNLEPYENIKQIISFAAPIITFSSALLGLFTETRKDSTHKNKRREKGKKVLTKWAWWSLGGLILGAIITIIGAIVDNKISGIEGCIKAEKDSQYNAKVDSANQQLKISRDTLAAILESSGKTVNKLNETYSKQLLGIEKQNQLLNKTERVAKLQDSIYDINKKIKYPLPDIVELSYNVYFKLDEQFQNLASVILLKDHALNRDRFVINQDGEYLLVDNILVDQLKRELFKWDNIFNNRIQIQFAQNYEIGKNNVSSKSSIIALSNHDEIISSRFRNLNFNLFYNTISKTFLLNYYHIVLKKESFPLPFPPTSFKSYSSFDLDKAEVLLLQKFPERFKSIKMFNLVVESKEFNRSYVESHSTENDGAFYW